MIVSCHEKVGGYMDVGAISGSNPYMNIASGQRINSGADDPAGLSITERMNSQIVGSQKNLDNIADSNNALSTAEGALNSISDSLGRIRELSLQASNGILSGDDKNKIQDEIGQLLSGIQDVAKDTSFNTKPLLDGSFQGIQVGDSSDGNGSQISVADSTLSSLGLDGYDVTGSFDISKVDSAIQKVNESRSQIGSTQNAFEYASNAISGKINNITSSMSKIKDANIAEEISQLKKNQILDQYKMQMQMIRQRNEEQKLGVIADFKL